ncbi:uncharacterized protein LOC111707706 [Eurytemora carolleeae]|uniref:uncharacterized protein LOC111707706 n=1 Tax=Eurytemora carolleeae TaxID=1294199 RepID=UPI000C7858A3|nr:uncharacterized protein LOC111707706 [Eurytemora carolleeae]|eukprot:XP_023336614.1 uncharacterized protein LOC111707706 [Eurytemora affinis]
MIFLTKNKRKSMIVILVVFLLSQSEGSNIQSTFISKEISSDLWKSKIIKTYQPCHSEIQCAGLVKSSIDMSACFYNAEEGICELANIFDEEIVDQPNPVKVKFRVYVQENQEQVTKPCPSTHPYLFLDEKACCERNLEAGFMNKTTGTRGLLLNNSKTCGFTFKYCPAGWICTSSSTLPNQLQIPGVGIGTSVKTFVLIDGLTLEVCQNRCEMNADCQAWVHNEQLKLCHLKKGTDAEMVIDREDPKFTAGFKSTFINLPLE